MILRTELITTPQGFNALKPEWDSLLSRSNQDSPFLSHSRLRTWWEVFGAESDLFVLTVRTEDGRLVGAVPAYLHEVGRRFKARALGLLGDHQAGAAGLTAIAESGSETEVFDFLTKSLLANPRDWDMLEFNYADPDSAFMRTLTAQARPRVIDRAWMSQRIKLPADWESYRLMLSPHRRRSLNQEFNASKRAGEELETIESASELEGAMRDFWRLHEQRMTLKMGPSFRVDPQYREFVERMVPQLLAENRLQLMFLRNGSRRVAGLYQFVYGNSTYGEKSGFDQSVCATLRPLIAEAIRTAIENHLDYFDLMLGEDAYKRLWGVNDVRHYSQVKVYGPALRGQLRLAHDAMAERLARAREARQQEPVAASVQVSS